jgi:hydroxymethylbilane synthase
MNRPIVLGSRASNLALWQTKLVKKKLEDSRIKCEIKTVTSSGDIDLKTPIYSMGITGVFTKELDQALLNQEIDVAVHSFKDVPTRLAKGICIGAVLKRGNWEDTILWKNIECKSKKVRSVATGSLRRKFQWKLKYPNDSVIPIRGNITSRIEKLKTDPKIDGVFFASAALSRLKIYEENEETLDNFLPAPCQGFIVTTCLKKNDFIIKNLNKINDKKSSICSKIERDFLRTLEGGCSAPIGAIAKVKGKVIEFKGGVFSTKGKQPKIIEALLKFDKRNRVGERLANEILKDGGREYVEEAK